MQPTLSFEQAPPISVPYRFFLTAPLFGVAAGLLLTWLGPAALASRWTPGAAALTHLIAAGFMLQTMCGALLQFVAVAAGANIWRSRLVAALVHPLITVGALLLATAFALGAPSLFRPAAALLAAPLGLFVGVMALALLRTPARGMTLHTLRLAVFGLLVTLTLGVTLAGTLGWPEDWPLALPFLTLVNVHVAWGLGGWALLLVIGVSYLVVPMFQLTPAYPVWLTRLLPAGLFLALLAWSLQLGRQTPPPWLSGVALAGMLLAALYAGVTLRLQSRRRRRVSDATLVFWRGAMVLLLALSLSWLLFEALPRLSALPRAPLWLGILALPGVFVSVITGMLYKIVPFLNWLHLQRQGDPRRPPPNMKQMIPERAMNGQMRLHFAAVALLLAAIPWPSLVRPAGLAFAASSLWLEWNLVGAVRQYAHFLAIALRDRTGAAGPGRES